MDAVLLRVRDTNLLVMHILQESQVSIAMDFLTQYEHSLQEFFLAQRDFYFLSGFRAVKNSLTITSCLLNERQENGSNASAAPATVVSSSIEFCDHHVISFDALECADLISRSQTQTQSEHHSIVWTIVSVFPLPQHCCLTSYLY